MTKRNNRHGSTLADALCGLFIVTLGLGLYFQTNQIINHRLSVSQQKLIRERNAYEKSLSHGR